MGVEAPLRNKRLLTLFHLKAGADDDEEEEVEKPSRCQRCRRVVVGTLTALAIIPFLLLELGREK